MSDDEPAAPETTGEQSNETLGSRLRAARESRDLSIEKIADELRIEQHVLRALEEDRLNDIEIAPVFVKGYIKQYGRLLELDYEELREAFRLQTGAEDVLLRPNRPIHLRDERQIAIWVITALAALLVGVALFVWWLSAEDGWMFNPLSDAEETDSVSVAAPITSRVLQPSEQIEADSPMTVSAESPTLPGNVASSDAPDGKTGPPATDAAPQSETDNLQASDNLELASRGDNESRSLDAEPEPGSIAMLFEFSDESWFELTDVRGRRLYYDLAQAGSRLSFMALPPAQVLLGNADAVSISVGSEALAVPNSGRRGNVAIFVIDPAQD
jgi:cytoskeleton protein RodZ